MRRWPDLEDWFAEPLLVRLDLAHRPWGTRRRTGPSSEGGSYVSYLSLVHGVRCDVDWVVSRNCGSLFDPRVGPRLGFDLDVVAAHCERMVQLGYSEAGGARGALTWAFSRLALWRGDPDITTINYDELVEFRDGIRRYCEHPDAGYIRASHVAAVRRGDSPEELVAQRGACASDSRRSFHRSQIRAQCCSAG